MDSSARLMDSRAATAHHFALPLLVGFASSGRRATMPNMDPHQATATTVEQLTDLERQLLTAAGTDWLVDLGPVSRSAGTSRSSARLPCA
jgi:hypothetical protein